MNFFDFWPVTSRDWSPKNHRRYWCRGAGHEGSECDLARPPKWRERAAKDFLPLLRLRFTASPFWVKLTWNVRRWPPQTNENRFRWATAHKTHIGLALRAEYADFADHRISNLLITMPPEWFNSVPGHHHSKGLVRFRPVPRPQRP